MTAPQVRFAATRYAGTQKVTRSEARHLRQHNAGFLVLHYRLGQGLGHSMPDRTGRPTTDWIQIVDGDRWVPEWPGDGNVRDRWFFRWNGSRLFSHDHGHYLMELSDPDFRAWWSAEVMRQLQATEADGVFADSYGLPTRRPWTPALPPDDPRLESAWAERQRSFTDYIRAQFAGRWRWIPNVGAVIAGADPSDYSNADGVMIEYFAQRGHRHGYTVDEWRVQMNRALALTSRDKIVIAQGYPGEDPEERLFVLGSYLLIKAKHTYINLFVQDKATVEAQGGGLPEWLPEYEIDLGAPIDPLPETIDAYLHPTWNMYVRRYANGLVVVNPAATACTASFGSTYRRVHPVGGGVVGADGHPPGSLDSTAVRTVTLGSHRAAILSDVR